MAVTRVRLLGDFRPHIDYALVMRDTIGSPFIACWAPKFGEAHPDGTVDCIWGQGHYFNDILQAVAYIKGLLEPEVDLRDAEEAEDVTDEIDLGYGCDRTGFCQGASCPQFFSCPDVC